MRGAWFPARLAWLAMFGDARRLVGGTLEGHVAAPAAPAAPHQQPLPSHHQVTQQLTRVGLIHDGAARHGDDGVVTLGTGFALSSAVHAAPGAEVALMAERDQRVGIARGLQVDVAPLATIAPKRAAKPDELLAAESDAAVAPVTRFDEYLGFIKKHRVFAHE